MLGHAGTRWSASAIVGWPCKPGMTLRAMPQIDSPQSLRAMLSDGASWRSIDVREELIFSRSHLLWARYVPLSRLELRFARLVPRHATRIVLCDDGDGLVERAAKVLGARRLHRPLLFSTAASPAWEKAGFELFSGVNVPSKAFGEHVEHDSGTPSISARRARCADAQRRRHGGGRQPAVRRISSASRSRPRPTCPAPSWCCASTTSRRRPTRWWWSIAPAARAASSARSR